MGALAPGPELGRHRPLPEKYEFRIGEVAQVVEVEPHVLRYWETEFRSIRPRKSPKGQRIYSRSDVLTLQKIKELLYDHGYTIAGARRKLRATGREPIAPDDPVVQQVDVLRTSLTALREEIVALIEELDGL
ncbi:MAG: MerR family transcriptional regulator [Deltaproteobacteria bacterium]|nr:MerR family transcriptional regulator [Deltaproteobacteria bacterium]